MARAGQQIGIANFFLKLRQATYDPYGAIVMPALCQRQMLKAPNRRYVRRDYRTTCV